MNRLTKSPLLIFISGSFASALIITAALLFLNPPQCPIDYTQAQVDASNCIIGANIGLGLIFLWAIAVFIVSISIAIILTISHKSKNPKV